MDAYIRLAIAAADATIYQSLTRDARTLLT
jgi:hypothetical protein